MYKHLFSFTQSSRLTWRRVFIDEADSIHIVSSTALPEARFYWFVTASWMNMLVGNRSIYLSQIDSLLYGNSLYHQSMKDYFKSIVRTSYSTYVYAHFSVRSHTFFRDIISTHPLQGYSVIRCDDEYIKSSISLPQLFKYVIQCRAPAIHNMVANFVTDEVKNLLHAGDTKGAMEALGVKEEDATTLIAAVTQNRMKELDRLKKTYEFKSGLEYSSTQAKEAALKNLQDKIKEIETQVGDIQARIQNYKTENCPICYDEPAEAVLTPCCTQVFCGSCILASLQRNPSCPMCRASMTPKMLKRILNEPVAAEVVAAEEEEEAQPEKKIDALVRILKSNPDGRFLVFSRYDNPFEEIETVLQEMNVKVKQLKGNRDVIASTLKQFTQGSIRCLLLNAAYAGAGLNITAATHVILTHALSLEEEKQILGRAYRMGRTEPLYFYKLLHDGETAHT